MGIGGEGEEKGKVEWETTDVHGFGRDKVGMVMQG